MAEVCPECGISKNREVLVGVAGREFGNLYYCGSIYWPQKETITVRGVACKALSEEKRARHEAEKERDNQYFEAAELLHDKSAQLAALQEENVRYRGALESALHDLATSEGLYACDNEEGHSLFQLEHPSKQKVLEALSTTPETGKVQAVIEAARGLCKGGDWNNGTHAKLHGYRQALIDAVRALNE